MQLSEELPTLERRARRSLIGVWAARLFLRPLGPHLSTESSWYLAPLTQARVSLDLAIVPSAFGSSFKFCGFSNPTIMLYSDTSPSDQQREMLLFCSQVALTEA